MSSALRVGIIAPRFAPFRGGVETYVESAASALAAEGAEVTVITQAPRAAGLPQSEALNGYAVERHTLPIGATWDLPALSAAHAASRTGRFDVLWAHSYHTPLAWLVAEQSEIPLVFTPHYHGVGHTRFRQALHRGYHPAGRRLMAASRRVVAVTDAEAELLLRDFPGELRNNKLKTIPTAVADPVRGREPYPGNPHVVLTVARQEPYKRTDLLIRAVDELRKGMVQVKLVVVGDGSALPSCRELVNQLGAHQVVTFTGLVDEETLRRWWATAALYATASEQEAYGIGLAEALTVGLPVVASDIPAHRELIHRAGPTTAARLCATNVPEGVTVTQIAEGIAQLITSTESAAQRAQQCTLPSTADMVAQLLDTLTEARQMVSRQ